VRKSWDAIFVQVLLWLTSYTTIEMTGELKAIELDATALIADTTNEQMLIAMLFMAAPRSK